MSEKQKDKNIRTGQQGTHEPWKRPGQTSQDPDHQHPPRKDDIGDFEQVNKTS